MIAGRRQTSIKKIVTFFVLALALLASVSHAQSQQPEKFYRIGYLGLGLAKSYKRRLVAFRQTLRMLGYIEGKNIHIEERYANGRKERLPALAEELVHLKPHVIVIHGSIGIRVVQRLDKTIPIIFPVHADPVGSGDVASLARPGGNVTGLSDYHTDLVAKRLELIKEVVPSASRVAVLWDPAIPVLQRQWKRIQAAAPGLGLTLLSLEVSSPENFDRALAKLRKKRPEGIVVFGYPTMRGYRRRTLKFALKNRLPTIYTTERNVRAGGLMSFGANFLDMYRRAATYVDKILKGAKPADLPVEQPRKFELVINLRTAKKLGLTIPPEVLLRATKVIR